MLNTWPLSHYSCSPSPSTHTHPHTLPLPSLTPAVAKRPQTVVCCPGSWCRVLLSWIQEPLLHLLVPLLQTNKQQTNKQSFIAVFTERCVIPARYVTLAAATPESSAYSPSSVSATSSSVCCDPRSTPALFGLVFAPNWWGGGEPNHSNRDQVLKWWWGCITKNALKVHQKAEEHTTLIFHCWECRGNPTQHMAIMC